MNTHSWGMAVASHNVANVSTAGFEPQRAVYATGPAGQGVRLDAVLQGGVPSGPGGTSFSAAQAVYDVTRPCPWRLQAPAAQTSAVKWLQ